MEEVYYNSHYSGGWRPLTREIAPAADGAVPDAGAFDSKRKTASIGGEGADAAASDAGSIIKLLSGLSADIDALSRRVISQGEKIDSLLLLMDERGTGGRKGGFGLPRK